MTMIDMSFPGKVEVEVGLLLRGSFRRFLNELKNRDYITDYTESKSFLYSKFLLRGTLLHLEAIKKYSSQI